MVPKPIKIVTDKDEFPIQPQDINTDAHFFDAFGDVYAEASARWLVELAQARGGWTPFTIREITAFSGQRPFDFNRLDDEDRGLLVYRRDRYHFTAEFITKCFLASPDYEPSVRIGTKWRNRNTDRRILSRPAGLPPGDRAH